MIDLTPLEVRQKKGDFRRAFRGYDIALVNDFLDLVADRMEELVKENMALQDRLEGIDEELDAYREKERALVDALMAAERIRDDARANAEKEASLLFKEAELEAERHRTAVAQALAYEEAAIRRVQARRAQLIREFRSFLERELGELQVIEDSLELSGQAEDRGDEEAANHDEAEDTAGDPGPEEADEPAAEAEDADLDGDLDEDEEAGETKNRQTDWLSSLVEE